MKKSRFWTDPGHAGRGRIYSNEGVFKMKHTLNFKTILRIVGNLNLVIIAVIGFSMIACDTGGGETDVLSAPAAVTAKADSRSGITITWNAVGGATGYSVYRSSTESGTYTRAGTSTKTSYQDSGLEADTTYYYKVAAYNAAGEGPQSSPPASAKTEIALVGAWSKSGGGTAFEVTSAGKFIMNGTTYDISVSGGTATLSSGGSTVGTFDFAINNGQLVLSNGTGVGTGVVALSPLIRELAGDISLILFQQKKLEINNPEIAGKKLIYTSNDPGVATVDANGVVTGVGINKGDLGVQIPAGANGLSTFDSVSGETTITVKTDDGRNLEISVKVTMRGNEEINTLPSLYEQFEKYIPYFGTIVDPGNGVLTPSAQILRHFNIVTPQNQQKPQSWTVSPVPTNATLTSNTPLSFSITNTSGENMMIGAIQNNLKWHFHVLFWHEQNQSWWNTLIGGTGANSAQTGTATQPWNPSPLTYDQAARVLKYWIETIMDKDLTVNGETKKYSEWVYSWDVLNEVILSYPERLPARTVNGNYEAVGTVTRPTQTVTGRGIWIPDANNPGATLHAWGDPAFTWRDALRYGNSDEEFWDGKKQGNAFVRALGGDAVYLMYKYARLNAPDAILYINDYDTFRKNKAKMIYDMVVELNDKWTKDPEYNGKMLINGMGAQEHNNIDKTVLTVDGITYDPIGTTVADVEYNWNLWSGIPNMKLAVSEIDLRVWDNGGDNTPPTLQNQIDQAKLYGEQFKIYLKYSKNPNGSHFDRITFWGHNDQNNWMSAGRPLWFDGGNTGNSYAKPAYYMVQNVLKEYAAAHP